MSKSLDNLEKAEAAHRHKDENWHQSITDQLKKIQEHLGYLEKKLDLLVNSQPQGGGGFRPRHAGSSREGGFRPRRFGAEGGGERKHFGGGERKFGGGERKHFGGGDRPWKRPGGGHGGERKPFGGGEGAPAENFDERQPESNEERKPRFGGSGPRPWKRPGGGGGKFGGGHGKFGGGPRGRR